MSRRNLILSHISCFLEAKKNLNFKLWKRWDGKVDIFFGFEGWGGGDSVILGDEGELLNPNRYVRVWYFEDTNDVV